MCLEPRSDAQMLPGSPGVNSERKPHPDHWTRASLLRECRSESPTPDKQRRGTECFCGGSRGGGLVAESCPSLASPWTVALQVPLSMGFPRQEHWSDLLFPSPGDLPIPGIKPGSPVLPADSLPTEVPRKLPKKCFCKRRKIQTEWWERRVSIHRGWPVCSFGDSALSH